MTLTFPSQEKLRSVLYSKKRWYKTDSTLYIYTYIYIYNQEKRCEWMIISGESHDAQDYFYRLRGKI